MIETIQARQIDTVLIGVPEKKLFSDVAPFYEELASEYNLVFADDLLSGLLRNNEYKSDAVHLNQRGYRLLAESIHVKDGRGEPYVGNEPMVALLVRLSVNSHSSVDNSHFIKHGLIAEPTYGGQIQPRSIPGVPAEAKVTLQWSEVEFEFPDGTSVQLQKPQVILSQLAYGELHVR